MGLDLLSVGVGAVVGGAGTVVTARLMGADDRRKDAWSAWVSLNEAVRSGDKYRVNAALNVCEIAWAHAHVPHVMYEHMATTSGWYRRWFAAGEPNDASIAHALLFSVHQFNVDMLRFYLKRRWWIPVRRRPKHLDALGNEVGIASLAVEPYLDELEDRQGGQGAPEGDSLPDA